jgi:hypothetical protein
MPDVELVRRDAVELVRTGSWPASTGNWTPSREDLASAVKALECPAVRRPVLKVGHRDSRFTPADVGDGEPAIGWVDNLRTDESGHTLIGDYVGMPAWIGQVMASAWPDRSIEGDYDYRCTLNHTHRFALKAVALLGVTPPAVGTLKSLQDVADLYGVNVAASDHGTGKHVELTIHAEAAPDVQVPNILMPVRAASDEKLRTYWTRGKGAALVRWGESGDFDRCVKHLRKYVEDPKGLCAEYHHEALGVWPGREHVKAAEGEDEQPMSRAQQIRDAWNASDPPYSQWVVEARPDAAIVVDDVDRTYRLYPVTWDGETPSFGEPQPHDPAAEKVLVFASRAESRPDMAAADPPQDPAPLPDTPPAVPAPVLPAAEPEPENTDPKEDLVSTDLSAFRSRLGLTDDADEQAILVALDALKAKADTPAEPTPEMVAASAAVAEKAEAEKDELRKEVTVLASQLQQVTAEVAAAKAEKAATIKQQVIQAAADQGKFTPAEREQWEKDYDEAPAAITRILASIAPGFKVPVMASGTTGSPEPTFDGISDDDLTEAFFGPGSAAKFKTTEEV